MLQDTNDGEDFVLAPPPSLLFRAVVTCSFALAALLYLSCSATSKGALLWQTTPLKATTKVATATLPRILELQPQWNAQHRGGTLVHQKALHPEPLIGVQNVNAWDGNGMMALVTASGMMLGAGLVILYHRIVGQATAEGQPWSMATIAGQGVVTSTSEENPLPPYAGKEAFRPDLFQPRGAVHTIPLSGVKYVKRRNYWFNRSYNATDVAFLVVTFSFHAVALIMGPMTYRPDCLGVALVLYAITGMGITFSYHRQLSHRSFTTPKWLEYLMAYCGALALEGDPLEWVSSHRYHHQFTETDRDPHTVNEGFWWSHMGWLLDHVATKSRTGDQSNAQDIATDPFYQFLQKTYPIHILLLACGLYAWGGIPYLVWGMCVRTCWVWHITWFVNSASHSWGYKTYKTSPPDESRNNWWVAILAFGEGWHNNHHAFQWSARHGLEWYQYDLTWCYIRVLQLLGLATNVKLPSEAKKAAARLA